MNITREEFLPNTTEDELFSVVSSVLERLKQNRSKTNLANYKGEIKLRGNEFSPSELKELWYSYKLIATDRELGQAIRRTIKEWK